MEKRKWQGQQKLRIVLEGLSGQIQISKLCTKYQISQSQYYKWRDQLLQYGDQAFENGVATKREQRLAGEIQRLKRIIGDLTVELKKNDEVYL